MLDIFGSGDPQKVIEKVSKLRFEGKIDKALSLLEKSLKGKPTDFRLLLEIGSIECDQGRYIKAVLTFKKARSINPSAYKEIIDFVEDIFYREKNGHIGSYLMDLYIEKRKFDEADKICKSIDSEERRELKARTEKDVQNIEKKGTFGRLEIIPLYKLAILSFNVADYETAERMMFMILDRYPMERENVIGELQRWTQESYGNPKPYIILGKIYLNGGEQEKAITSFQQATNLDPTCEDEIADILSDFSDSSENVSETSISQVIPLYIKRGEKEKALKLIERLEKTDNPPYKEIINFYTSLEKIYKDDKDIRMRLLRTAAKMGDIAIVDRVINYFIDENYPELLSLLPILQEMINNGYENAKLYQDIAKILVMNGEYVSAMPLIEKAYQMDSEDTYVVSELLAEILKNNSSLSKPAIILGKIYASEGDIDKAVMLYEHALSLEDTDIDLLLKNVKELSTRYEDNLDIKTLYAKVLIKSNQVKEAGEIIKQLILKYDNPHTILPVLDSIASTGKEHAEVAKDIYESIDWGEDFIALLAGGEIYRKSGDYDKAIQYYKKALNIDNSKIDIVKEGIFSSIKEGETSIPLLLFAVELMLDTNDTSGIDSILKIINDRMKPEEMDSTEIVKLYQRLKEKLPDNIEVARGLIRSLFARELYAEVEKEAKKLLNVIKKDNSGELYFILGKTCGIRGNLKDASVYLYQASYMNEEWAEESVSILNELVEKDYNNLSLHYALSQCSALIGDYTTAADELFTIIQIDPARADRVLADLLKLLEKDRTNAALYFYVGRIYLKKSNINEAIRYFESCVTLDENYADNIITIFEELESEVQSPAIPFFLGKLYMKKKLYTRSAEYLFTAVDISPSLIENVLTLLNDILKESPKEIATRIALAEIYIKNKKYVNAAKILYEVITIDKDQLDTVVSIFDEILTHSPDNTEVLLILSSVYKECEMQDKMIEVFKKIISVDVSMSERIIDIIESMDVRDIPTLYYLADLYISRREFKESVRVLNEILFLGFMENKEKVIEYIDKILDIEPSQVDAGFLKGRLMFDDEKYEDSIKLFNHIVDRIDDNSIKREVLFMIFQSYQKIEDKEKAKETLSQIREISTPDEYYDLIIRLKHKARDERIKKISALLEADKATDEEKILLARFYREKGEYDKALDILKFVPPEESKELWVDRLKEVASVYEDKGDLITALETLINVYPMDNSVREEIKRLSKQCGFYREAIMWSDNDIDESISDILSRLKEGNYPVIISHIKID